MRADTTNNNTNPSIDNVDKYAQLSNFPEELRKLPIWCVSGEDKVPQTGFSGALRNTPVVTTDTHTGEVTPPQFHTFNDAVTIAKQHNLDVGCVLRDGDGFVCIDLDIKDKSKVEIPDLALLDTNISNYPQLVSHFNTYAEMSKSGLGLHLWVKSNLATGKRGKGVEVYSKERYIICTGKSVTDINYGRISSLVIPFPTYGPSVLNTDTTFVDAALTELLQVIEASRTVAPTVQLEEIAPTESDDAILNRARSAENSISFNLLWSGKWQDPFFKGKYESQSDADHSFIERLAFFTKSNEQVRRLFKASGLFRHEKRKTDAGQNEYINRSLAQVRGFHDRDSARSSSIDLDNIVSKFQNSKDLEDEVPTAEPVNNDPRYFDLTDSQGKVVTYDERSYNPSENTALEWPPGLLGEFAKTIYLNSMRPLKTVSIASAIVTTASIAGRAYNTEGKNPQGLNVYALLLGKSGIGKSALLDGNKILVHALKTHSEYGSHPNELSMNVVNNILQNSQASAQSIVGTYTTELCCGIYNNEFGRVLKSMKKGNVIVEDLLAQLTRVFDKSGANDIAPGIQRSKKDNSDVSCSPAAVTYIGDSTPETYINNLSDDAAEDGTLSRFLHFVIKSDYVDENEHDSVPLAQRITDHARCIVQNMVRDKNANNNTVGMNTAERFQPIEVKFTDKAAELKRELNKYIKSRLRTCTTDAERAPYMRMSLYVVKLASLCAVFDNPHMPEVTEQHFVWASKTVDVNLKSFTKLYESKKLDGAKQGHDNYYKAALKFLKTYLKRTRKFTGQREKYNELQTKGLVAQSYFKNQSFKNIDGKDFNKVKKTIEYLVETGVIQPVPKEELEKYGLAFKGDAYAIDLETLNNEISVNK